MDAAPVFFLRRQGNQHACGRNHLRRTWLQRRWKRVAIHPSTKTPTFKTEPIRVHLKPLPRRTMIDSGHQMGMSRPKPDPLRQSLFWTPSSVLPQQRCTILHSAFNRRLGNIAVVVRAKSSPEDRVHVPQSPGKAWRARRDHEIYRLTPRFMVSSARGRQSSRLRFNKYATYVIAVRTNPGDEPPARKALSMVIRLGSACITMPCYTRRRPEGQLRWACSVRAVSWAGMA